MSLSSDPTSPRVRRYPETDGQTWFFDVFVEGRKRIDALVPHWSNPCANIGIRSFGVPALRSRRSIRLTEGSRVNESENLFRIHSLGLDKPSFLVPPVLSLYRGLPG